jgi:hypothetical protein
VRHDRVDTLFDLAFDRRFVVKNVLVLGIDSPTCDGKLVTVVLSLSPRSPTPGQQNQPAWSYT